MAEIDNALARALGSLTEDLLFASIGAEADTSLWKDVVKRREAAYGEVLRGHVPPGPEQLDAWMITLTRAMTPVRAPAWMPMASLVDGGATLLAGARGMRSLFSSKPSEKDVQRVRRLGALAVNVACAIMGTDGALGPDERRMQRALVASLGVGEADENVLVAIGPVDPATIAPTEDVDAKTAKLLVEGAWLAAMQDGLDARDEGAVATVANRLGVPMQDVGALGAEVKREGEARRTTAAAAIEAIAFLLAEQPERARVFSKVLADLAVPAPYRGDLMKLAATPAPSLAPRSLDKTGRATALALAWLVALHDNPTYVRLAAMAVRHDRVADHLGSASDGPRVRQSVQSFVDETLAALAKTADDKR